MKTHIFYNRPLRFLIVCLFLAADACEASGKGSPKHLELKSWGNSSAYGGNLIHGKNLVTIYSGNVRVTVEVGEVKLQLIADCCVLDHDLGKAALYGVWEEPVKVKSGFVQKVMLPELISPRKARSV